MSAAWVLVQAVSDQTARVDPKGTRSCPGFYHDRNHYEHLDD
jgi:hypothetical protein